VAERHSIAARHFFSIGETVEPVPAAKWTELTLASREEDQIPAVLE
jgi:hypothetical protein